MKTAEYRELCSNIKDLGQTAAALEGVMESLAEALSRLYAVIGGAAEYRKTTGETPEMDKE